MGYPALFYDAVNGDREYDAGSFESLIRAFFNSGVSRNGGGLQVATAGGMNIRVSEGLVNCDGKIGIFETPQSFQIQANASAGARLDLVVARRNDTLRTITVQVKTGGGVERTAGIYEVVLARITVPAGASEITAADIDMTEESGRTEITEAVPIDDALTALTNQFNEWMQNLRNQLSDNQAANLQSQIDNLTASVSSANTTASEARGIASEALDAAASAGLTLSPIWTNQSFQSASAWDNASDITQFGPQTVVPTNNALSQYPAVLVEFRLFGTYFNAKKQRVLHGHRNDRLHLIVWAGQTACAQGNDADNAQTAFQRHVTYDQATGISFGHVIYGKVTNKATKPFYNNNKKTALPNVCLIPMAIYGVKGIVHAGI